MILDKVWDEEYLQNKSKLKVMPNFNSLYAFFHQHICRIFILLSYIILNAAAFFTGNITGAFSLGIIATIIGTLLFSETLYPEKYIIPLKWSIRLRRSLVVTVALIVFFFLSMLVVSRGKAYEKIKNQKTTAGQQGFFISPN